MEDNKRNDFIKDEEFKMFFEQDFSSKLQDDLRETPLGKRIAMLESLGLGISIEGMVEKYISKAGYTMDLSGNLHIQDDTMIQIFTSEEMRISDELEIDISKITDANQLRKVIVDPEYKKSVAKYGVESTIDLYNLSPDARKEFKETGFKETLDFLFQNITYEDLKKFHDRFNSFKSTQGLKDSLKNDKNLNMTEEEIEQAINNVEQKTVESNIINKASSKTIRHLYQMRILKKRLMNGDISAKAEMDEVLKQLKTVLNGSQYKNDITNENGEIDVEKSLAFLDDWEIKRNDTKLFENLSTIQSSNIADLNIAKISKVLVLFAQAEKSEDENNKKIAISIMKSLNDEFGIDLLDENKEKIDLSKVQAKYRELTDGEEIEDIIQESEWNEFTASRKLDRVDKAIDYDLGITSTSRDQVNANKEAYNKLLEKAEQDKKKVLKSIIKGGNYSTEQVVALLYKFRCQELAENSSFNGKIDGRQLRSTMEHGIARVIQEYIQENSEEFKDYLKNGNISGKYINETINNNTFTEQEKASIDKAFEVIGNTFKNIDERKDADITLRKELKEKLDSLVGTINSDISEKDKEYIFSMAKILRNDGVFPKDLSEQLVRIDRDKFKEIFTDSKEDSQNVDGRFSVRKLVKYFGKGIIELPKKILDTETKETKGTKETAPKKGLKGFFKKLFGKEEPLLLAEAENSQNELQDKAFNTNNQQLYSINTRFKIDHNLAIEQTEVAQAAKNQQEERQEDGEVASRE